MHRLGSGFIHLGLVATALRGELDDIKRQHLSFMELDELIERVFQDAGQSLLRVPMKSANDAPEKGKIMKAALDNKSVPSPALAAFAPAGKVNEQLGAK